MVQAPDRIPGLNWATIIMGVYGAIWIALEGDLRRVLLLAGLVTLVATGRLARRFWGGRLLPVWLWLLSGVALGAVAGFSMGPLTLALMVLKSGLHAHGPEFSLEQVNWVALQIPLWLAAGVAAGLAGALLFLGVRGTRVGDGG